MRSSVATIQREALERAYRAALAACDPAHLLRVSWATALDTVPRLHVLAIGKGSPGLVRAVGERRPDATGIGLVVPGSDLRGLPPGVECLETDHPIPTPRNVAAAKRVESFVASLSPEDTLLMLISGGGSAQLCLPADGLSLDDVRQTTARLIKAGTPIDLLNAVRGRLEKLKAGGLARMTSARVHAYAISDVGNHGPETISSGPLHRPQTDLSERVASLAADPNLPDRVRSALAQRWEAPPTDRQPRFEVIGSYRTSVAAVRESLAASGLSDGSPGRFETSDAKRVGRDAARAAIEAPNSFSVQGCELQADASGSRGVGGRCQHGALAAAIELDGTDNVSIAVLSTDGIDGPTEAAGAIVDGCSASRMRAAGVVPEQALATCDSNRALAASGDLLSTGPTGTNVNDLLITVHGTPRRIG